ncbi:hypothetical protein Fmac_028883 [Flemingia macrophylla]|uniref:non-reducing end alpha-L-arabinofuranosidase n=1 Tax=Flemingia macrophylla TaxID=520843 RepID=A0ABD1L8S5_9FABA
MVVLTMMRRRKWPRYSYVDANSMLVVNASTSASSRRILDTFLGAFLEKIVGNESLISVSINRSSCFERNKAALQMVVHCGALTPCPSCGVGISNPGYWGMNIEQGKRYRVVYHVTSEGKTDFQLSFTGVDVLKVSSNITYGFRDGKWNKVETIVEAKATNHFSSLQITTTMQGSYLLDQGHGFRKGLFQMVADLKPKFLRFPGISRHAAASNIASYVQDALDGIEFARGSPRSRWGSVRAAMGHPKSFDLRYVAVGNEDCGLFNYEESNMFSKSTQFDHTSRSGPKAFVSEYAVWKQDAGNGSLLAAVAEAAFLIGLEKNSDVVEMVCYAPLFSNINDRIWVPDAIVFDSYQLYGTPSYWVQKLFIESSGATFLDSTLNTNSSNKLIASSIIWQNSTEKKNYLRVKVVNFGTTAETLSISINGLNATVQQNYGVRGTVLISTNVMDENSFSEPQKVQFGFVVVLQTITPVKVGNSMNVILDPYSVTSLDLLI